MNICTNCKHPIGYTSFKDRPYHIRKGCEYSVTCWECNCREAASDDGMKSEEADE